MKIPVLLVNYEPAALDLYRKLLSDKGVRSAALPGMFFELAFVYLCNAEVEMVFINHLAI